MWWRVEIKGQKGEQNVRLTLNAPEKCSYEKFYLRSFLGFIRLYFPVWGTSIPNGSKIRELSLLLGIPDQSS